MLKSNKAQPSSSSRRLYCGIPVLLFLSILVGAQFVIFAEQGDVSKIQKKNHDEGVLAVNETRKASNIPFATNKTLSRKAYTPKRPSPLSVKHVVDFAVVGFPKCGTTTLNHIFKTHVAMLKGDTCIHGRERLMAKLQEKGAVYNHHDVNGTMLRGLKCPRFLEHYHGTLPANLPFIVTVRHPVRWFESFYNMVGRNRNGPKKFLGACQDGAILCTDRAQFYLPLSKLGQTNLTQGERDLIGVQVVEGVLDSLGTKKRFRNPVFLIESTQLGDTNTSRRMLLSDDLAEFVGLEQHSLRDSAPHVSPGKQADDSWRIQICDSQHAPIRAELMKHARVGGRWLRDYFLPEGKGVHSSSPEFLMELLEKWEFDPCDEEKSE
jgi:hypothetical protein